MEMPKILILEDNNERYERMLMWLSKTVESFLPLRVDCLDDFVFKAKQHPDIVLVFLDHDLGNRVFVSTEEEDSGSGVARYLAENKDVLKNAGFIVHSLNPDGAKNMKSLLKDRDVSLIAINILLTKLIFIKQSKVRIV